MLQVVPDLAGGSLARAAVDMALFLKAAGGSAVVASAGGRMVHELDRANIPHIILPLQNNSFLSMRRNARLLEEVIEDYNVDIVHASARGPAWSAFFAAKRRNKPLVTTFYAPYSYASRGQKLFNSIMARGDRVIAISEYIAIHASESYGLEAGRLRLVPRGVDLFRFNPDHVTPERMVTLAETWRLRDGEKVILCASKLNHVKGHLVLLDALAKLGRKDFICIIAGEETQNMAFASAIEQQALDLNLEGRVVMVGHCSDMPTAYMLADVVVAPSIEPEGFGRVAVEAQAMGRPVIASDIGGLRESILPGQTGWLVEAGKPELLAEALVHALALTSEQRLRVASEAKNYITNHFSREQMGWATLDVYQELYGHQVPWDLQK